MAQLLKNICKKEAFIVNIEMAYYVHTQKAEKVLWPQLFWLNGITQALAWLAITCANQEKGGLGGQ